MIRKTTCTFDFHFFLAGIATDTRLRIDSNKVLSKIGTLRSFEPVVWKEVVGDTGIKTNPSVLEYRGYLNSYFDSLNNVTCTQASARLEIFIFNCIFLIVFTAIFHD